MIRRRGIMKGIVFSLLAALLLPIGTYAQPDEEISTDTVAQEESLADSEEPGDYEGSVSSSDSAGFGGDEGMISVILPEADDSEEELVGANYDGTGSYLPYENAKYYLKYQIEANNEVTITHCSPNADSTAEYNGDIVIPDEIEGYPVTKIGNSAFTPSYVGQFYGTLTLPKGLKSIEGHAFNRQTNLTGDLILPDGVTSVGREAFYNCTGFNGKLILSKELTIIEPSAFRYCSGFNGSLIFPDGLTEIGEFAFGGCTGLQGDIRLPEGLIRIDSSAFSGCSGFNGTLTLPSTLTRIGWSTFSSCSGLTGDLVLPDNLSYLGDGAFSGCSGFTGDLVLPDSLTYLGSTAFYGCRGFNGSLILPKGVGTIEKYMFYGCTEILDVSIPASITSIGENAFYRCCGLANVYYEGGNWGTVTKETGNLYLENANIHCNSYYSANNMPPTFRSETPVAVIKPSGSSTPIRTMQDFNAYSTWTDTVSAYLYDNGNGVTRVECYDEKVIIENYDSNLRYQGGWTLDPELPLWGGFYAGEKYNFLIFGQENPNEDDSVEVIRVVKYDKAWNRLGHASLKGANTTIPFEAGSLRCDEYGGMLYVHTSHQMYTNPRDGLRHQANLTFSVREIDTRITDWRYDISNNYWGYVSHSFNQFLLVDKNSNIITLDHGDGHPRAAALMRYPEKAGRNAFAVDTRLSNEGVAVVKLIQFPGYIGENNTNASVGGLAETSSGYIAAYNYSPSGEPYIRNIHISYVPRDSFAEESVVTWTNPAATGWTPVIASAGDEGGYVLWYNSINSDSVSYVHYDAQGNISQVQSCSNVLLSDCQPILYRGNLVWYASGKDGMAFYTLNESGISTYDPTNPNQFVRVPQDLKLLRGFVRRLFTVCLGRDCGENEVNYWVDYLSSYSKTAAEVAQGFFFSDEFINKGYSDQEYVDILYRTMFDRNGGPDEKNYWLKRFENGMSRLYVYRGYAQSIEFSNLCDRFGVIQGSVDLIDYRDQNEGATGFMARLYTKMLGREGFSEDELEFWCRAYLTGERTIEDIATVGFLHSPELINQNLSNEEFAARMYKTFLDREPGDVEIIYWADKLSTGQETRDTLVYGFTLSQEFAELKASYGL